MQTRYEPGNQNTSQCPVQTQKIKINKRNQHIGPRVGQVQPRIVPFWKSGGLPALLKNQYGLFVVRKAGIIPIRASTHPEGVFLWQFYLNSPGFALNLSYFLENCP